jgi:hypothetical protein
MPKLRRSKRFRGGAEDEDEELEAEPVDPALAAMMGFSSFGGGA